MNRSFRSQPPLRWLASLLLLGSLCSLISLAPPRLVKLLPAKLLPASKRPSNNDPIGFSLRADKTSLRLGETLRLTITARHLNIPPSLLFSTEDATAYRLKLLLPEGFVVTGGSFRDFIEGQLKPGQAPAVYTLEGYFSQVPQQARFRLLRGNAQANEQSLFVDKAQLTLDVRFDPASNGRVAAAYSACIEAESGSGNRSLYADSQASGGQAMGGFGNASEYMSYSVSNVPAAGSYSLQLSYVSGDAQAVMGVVVNGGTVQTVSAPGLSRQTGPYGQASLNVSLNAGSNTIRIQGSGQGGFNLDRFCLAGSDTPPPASLAISPSGSQNVGAASGSLPVTVNSSVTWTATSSDASWLSVSPTSGSGNGSISVSYGANTSPSARSASVTVSGQGVSSQQLTITQAASSPGTSYSACVEAESGSGNRSLYADSQASGGQGVNGFGSAGEYMSYSVSSVPAAGSYSLQLSYVSGDAQAVMGVVVNGGTVQTVSAPGLSRQTGPYGQASLNVSLNAGSNTIRIQGSGQGGFNLDRFCLTGGGCSSAPSLVLGTPSCTGSSVYSVGFTAQSGATVTASAGSVQGSSVVNVPVGTNVVVTASQGSCSTQQTANSPTSCGTSTATMVGGFAEGSLSELTALAPFVPDNNQVSSWAALTPQFISNGQIKYGIHNSIGATGFWLSEDNANPKNLINASGGADFATPSTPEKWDKGRALFYSVYGTPRGSNQDIYYQGGQQTGFVGTNSDDTGWNPNMGGDRNFHSSPILFYQRKTVAGYGEVLYAQVQPYHWSMDRQLAEVKTHCWYWLEGKFLRYFVIIDNFRTDTQRKYEGREQEGIAMYVLANMYNQTIYTGAPKANQASTSITTPIQAPNNQSDTGPRLTSECWMACSNGPNTLVLFTPYNSCFKGKQFIDTGDDNYVSNAASYMDASLYTDMDNSGTTAYSGYVYVGSEANFRSWYNSSSVALRPFKFSFNNGKRQGWASVNGRFIRENGNMVFYIGDSHTDNGVTSYSAKLVSPTGSWPSSSLSTLYVNLTFSGTLNLDVSWLKPGQTDANTGAQTKQVTLTGNGSPQTYAIQMGGNGWDGTISQISLSPQNRNNPGISTLRPNWISDTNQAPN